MTGEREKINPCPKCGGCRACLEASCKLCGWQPKPIHESPNIVESRKGELRSRPLWLVILTLCGAAFGLYTEQGVASINPYHERFGIVYGGTAGLAVGIAILALARLLGRA